MKSYRITLNPLEPYFFGGERGFGFGSVKGCLKQRYFISSLETPAQTTLLGALRYAVLAANGALIKDFSKDSDNRKRADELVGPASFDFSPKQSYGAIGKVHPLFILDGEDYYVPTPMNHMSAENLRAPYAPMEISPCPEGITLGKGGEYSPDYKAKHGCGGGWLNLSDNNVVQSGYDVEKEDGMFQSHLRVGINSHRCERAEKRNDDDSFFKKEYKLLRKGKFAFFAELDPARIGMLEQGVTVYLGQNKSAFILKAVERENDLSEKIAEALSKCAQSDFWYAPADCRFEESYNGFALAKSRLFRHLTTGADNRFYYRVTKSEKLYRLLNAGAVFYGEEPGFAGDEPAKAIGMNELIKITKRG